MAIVQISKIQQRAGNLVDLPQLDNGEFGWATDTNRLFIGRTGNNYSDENIEVLTSYSNISFSQIEGSDGGNLNITTPLNGQIFTYVSSTDTWENYSGNASQFGGTKLQLGSVSNISMTGGAIGYVLQTDGLGNLAWSPKNSLYTIINGLTNNVTGNIVTMTVANTTPYTNGQSITISGANISNSNASSNINGQSFYIKVDANFGANSNVVGSGNVVLYTDIGLLTTANGAGLTSYTIDTGIATAILGGSGTSSVAGGANTSVQFNDQGASNGVAGFTFNKSTTTLTVSSGNIITGNLNATSTITALSLVSNIATGTSPLIVTSTTQVANLNAATAGVAYSVAGANVSGVVANATYAATTGVAYSVAGANVSGVVANATYAATTGVAYSVAGANVSGEVSYAATANSVAGSNVSGVVANATYAATAGVAYSVAGANVSGEVSYAATANSVAGSNVSGAVGLSTYATTANAVAGANVSGQVSYAAIANSVAVANVSGIGNIATINLDGNASNILYGNGIFAAAPSPGVSYGDSNVATFLASYGSNTITTTGNIAAGNISVGTGNVTLGTLTTGANTTAGTITGNFSLSTGSRLNATYADLAEYYESDKPYEPGTVLAFGGDKEVTLAEDSTTRVAGVVSTNPAYVMNSSCEGKHTVALALQGRVPCKVRGKIFKGDMLVSGGNGFARPVLFPVLGTVIGKALENFEGEGVIEVAISRL